MNLERYCRDLETVLEAHTRAAAREWCGRQGAGEAPCAGGLDEVTSIPAVLQLRASQRQGAVDAWVVQAATELAVEAATRPEQRLVRTRLRESAAATGIEWTAAEAVLVAAQSAAEFDRLGHAIVAGGRGLADALVQLRASRLRGYAQLGTRPLQGWQQVRGRKALELAALGAAVMRASEQPYRDALQQDRARSPVPPELASSWVTLPRFLAGRRYDGVLPAADEELMWHVVAALGLDRTAEPRLRFDLADRAHKRPGCARFVIVPGRHVLVCCRPMGPLRDYHELLWGLGQALRPALIESCSLPRDRLADPAIDDCFGALFASLASDAGWLEWSLRVPVTDDLVQALWVRRWLHIRIAAAVVVATPEGPEDPALPAAPGEQSMTRALRFDHPEVPVPWIPSWSRAADRLAGWVVAAALQERLATRWGRDWYRRSAAGRWLRDLWASAAHRRLGELADDLDLEPSDPEALLWVWPPASR